jgi:hypothetical protein
MSQLIRPAATVVAIALATACSGDGMGAKEQPGTPGIQLLTNLPAADSIGAFLDPLSIEVRDAGGRKAVGTTVQVEALPVPPPGCDPPCVEVPSIVFSPDGTAAWTGRVTLTTDASGVAHTRAMLGGVAGGAGFTVQAPAFGYDSTFHLGVRPGAVAHIDLAPADTAVLGGNGYRLRVNATDRLGNPSTETVTLTTPGDSVTLNTPSYGVVFAQRYGRTEVVATAGSATAHAFVSIVPDGEVGATRDIDDANTTVMVMLLSGGRRREFRVPSHTTAEDWSPDGNALLLRYDEPGQPQRISLLSLGDGTVRTVVDAADNPIVATLADPRFSADGQWVYFSGTLPAVPNPTLWRVRPNGSGLQQLAAPTGPYTALRSPDPSPDGVRIAYSGRQAAGDGPSDLYLYNLSTGVHAAVLHDSAAAPRWSTSGAQIAFVGSGSRPNVVRPDGTGRRMLADVPVRSMGGWSTDDRWVVAQGDTTWLVIEVPTGKVVPLPRGLVDQIFYPIFMPPTGLEGARAGRTTRSHR